MEEWKEYKLGDVLSIKYGKDHKRLADGNIPIYGSGGIMRYGESSLYSGPSILIPRKGSLNNIMYSDKPFWTVDTMFWTIINEEIANPLFVYYSICKKDFASLNVGSAVPSLTVPVIEDIDILLPSKKIQDKVVSILKSLDDKIEINRRINDNLEQQAQALFKSWFVDFEPFKDGEFIESELGMIPKGWRIGTLGDICVTNKRSYKGDFAYEIEYIDTGSVINNVIDSTQILNPATDKIPSRARRAVTEGDIIYSSVRPNQRHYALLFNPSSNTVVSTGFVVITANWSGYRYYIYQYLIQDEIVDKLQAIAEQSVSTFPSLNAADITNLKIIIPPNDVVDEFAAICCPFIEQIEKNQQESRRLASLRDTLLPKLMSGELKVNDMRLSEKQ